MIWLTRALADGLWLIFALSGRAHEKSDPHSRVILAYAFGMRVSQVNCCYSRVFALSHCPRFTRSGKSDGRSTRSREHECLSLLANLPGKAESTPKQSRIQVGIGVFQDYLKPADLYL